jgi:hypothetical protein
VPSLCSTAWVPVLPVRSLEGLLEDCVATFVLLSGARPPGLCDGAPSFWHLDRSLP